MARIRSIKLGFFQNEELCAFSAFHRLLFEGLWLLADREGRLEDRPKRIKAQLFPYDELEVSQLLDDLAAGADPFIQRYVVDGRRYLHILGFTTHQRPANSEAASTLPAPPPRPRVAATAPDPEEVDETTDDDVAPTDIFVAPTEKEVSKGREGNGLRNGEGEGSRELTLAPPPPNDLVELWNQETAGALPKAMELSDLRRKRAKARLADRPLEAWREVIRRLARSRFCRGENDRGWVATFDFLLAADTAVKVLEGKYDDRSGRPPPATSGVPEAVRARCEAAGLNAFNIAKWFATARLEGDVLRVADPDDRAWITKHYARQLGLEVAS